MARSSAFDFLKPVGLALGAMVMAACGGAAGENGTSPGETETSPLVLDLKVSAVGAEIAPPSPASECSPLDGFASEYLVYESGRLSWNDCSPDSISWTYTRNQGSRILSPAEMETIQSAVAGVLPSQNVRCGADAPVLLLDVRGENGVELLVDDFYAGCPGQIHAGRAFVTGLWDLWRALRDLP